MQYHTVGKLVKNLKNAKENENLHFMYIYLQTCPKGFYGIYAFWLPESRITLSGFTFGRLYPAMATLY